MKKIIMLCLMALQAVTISAQQTYPVNGSHDKRPGLYAFINANIVISAEQTITDGILLIKNDKIEAAGKGLSIPKGYIKIDLKGKYIYPSFVDAFTTYGLPQGTPPRQGGGFGRTQLFISTKAGAYSWNEAIRPEITVKSMFAIDSKKAEEYKKLGFGTVQTLSRDGIARGVSIVSTLNNSDETTVILKDQAAAHYSFSKGSSANSYPTSLMGSIALLRQTYLDAAWYKTQKSEYNISLDEFNKSQSLTQIFEAGDALSVLRADKIGDEFGKQYIFKTDGKEYQRIDEAKATGGSFIIPLNFPKPFDIEDPADARNISYTQMKDWEMAPSNPAALEKAGIKFAITGFGLESNPKDFWNNLRTAIKYGLSEKQALKSLTEVPAQLLGINDMLGTLSKGKLANFIICSDNIFKKDNIIYENWVQGNQYIVSKIDANDLRGTYSVQIEGLPVLEMKIGGSISAYDLNIERSGTDSIKVKGSINRTGDLLSMNFDLKKNPAGTIRLSGYINSDSPLGLRGDAIKPDGTGSKWTATFREPFKEVTKKENPEPVPSAGQVIYPFMAYGYTESPKSEQVLFRNATVWTNEKEGRLSNTDVLIEGGKIKAIGKNLKAASAKVIDASGKHLTPGIIDEHSHIAGTGGINEGAQSVSSEVRIADIITSEDINIYRQLAGGVTTSHILHGSANAIGGQTQLIKLRWGKNPEQMKFEGSDGFIKFALGENVKQSNFQIPGGNLRFPQSRMGVEQVFIDAFTRAKEYKAARAVKGNTVRRDLELDALVEILDNKRFITCHSYVQSEINMLMHVADSMGFKINTFTHILEGYKVADGMAKRGIAGSTFSDWWAYKNEVAEAIPYNGKIMHEVGVLTGFNSDDAEMARRLNQEAAKAITYGGMNEEDALKLVTLNPARMLHIDNKVGSVKVGKDADLVLWSDNPLSIYAKAEKTFVDGIAYWDIDQDAEKQKALKADQSRIIQKMIEAKGSGSATVKPALQRPRLYECETLESTDQYSLSH